MPVFVVTLITKWGFSEPLASFTKLSEAEEFAKRMKAQLKEPGSKIVIYEVDEPFIDFGEFVAALTRAGRPRAVSCSSACRQRGYDDGMEYGMTKEYAFTRNWTEWEVFREFVQNALDEMHEVMKERPLYYPCRYEGLRTVIFDAGRGLATYHLLVGTSEKKPWQRGRFGEGMKIALLTAIARGMSVTMESGDKVFTPMFIVKNLEGREFDVFCVCYKKAKTPITGTMVRIAVGRNLCEEYKKRIVQGVLSMRHDCVLYTVKEVGKEGEPGFRPWYDVIDPICSEDGKPWIYVRDIGITSFEAASDRTACFSYNLFDVELDESRRIPAFYTVESEIKRVWYYVTWYARWGDPKAKELLVKFIKCLMEQCKDVEYRLKIAAEADMHVFSYVFGEERDYLINVFQELYGKDTVVINNPELARMAEYLGVPFIFCNRRVGEELEDIFNVKQKMVEFLKKKIGDIVPKEAMSEGMRKKLELLEKIGSIVFKMKPKELEAIAYTIMDEDIGGVAEESSEGDKFLIRLNYKRLKFFCEEANVPPEDKSRECMKEFLANLAHEITHIRTKYRDLTKDYQQALTDTTGESLTEAIYSSDLLKKLLTEYAELFK